MSKSHDFDFETILRGHDVRVTGSIDPGEAATGPTYDCGGTPGCGPSLDELNVFLIHKRKDGRFVERELHDDFMKELEDKIIEQAE